MGILLRVFFNLLKKLGLGGVGEWRRGRRAGQASTASPPLHYLQPTSLISIGIGISAMFVVCSYVVMLNCFLERVTFLYERPETLQKCQSCHYFELSDAEREH